MARQGYDSELRRYNGRGGARCSSSKASSTASQHTRAPVGRSVRGAAVQQATRDALAKLESGGESTPRDWTQTTNRLPRPAASSRVLYILAYRAANARRSHYESSAS